MDDGNWIEGEITLKVRYNPEEIGLEPMVNNVFKYAFESEGFGEIVEIEIK